MSFISKNKCLINRKIFLEETKEIIFKSFSDIIKPLLVSLITVRRSFAISPIFWLYNNMQMDSFFYHNK